MMTPTALLTSPLVRTAALTLAWLALISGLHARLNTEPQKAATVLMGYMPVISNLAAPLVDAASRGKEVEFKALKFASFAEMADAFRHGHIQAAFIIAPLAVALHRQGVPLKVVYIGNRHESTLVVRKDLEAASVADLAGRRIAVPIRFSGHLLALRRALRSQGIDENGVNVVEIPPPDMPAALASGGIDGYFVGEPFAAKSIRSGMARKLAHVEDLWPKFICNLMIVREDFIRMHPERVRTLVSAAARSGIWAAGHLDEATERACGYWGQDRETVLSVFKDPPNRCRFDLYVPVVSELDELREEMERAGLIEKGPPLDGLVDDRFARAAAVGSVPVFEDVWPRGWGRTDRERESR